MDPQAVLREMLYALANGDRDGAARAAQDLSEWIDKGGFLPAVHAHDDAVTFDI